MIIEHDTYTGEIRAECEGCGRQWLFEECEVILSPYPHVECPVCGEWIPLF